MRNLLTKTILFNLLAGLITLALAASAQAQEQIQRGYSYRVTAGTVQTRGWENNLVRNNPNLAKWHWSPITSSRQAIRTVPGKYRNGPKKLPEYHYSKPKHVPFTAQKKQGFHYMKPKHVALPENQIVKAATAKSKLVSSNVNGRIRTASHKPAKGVRGRLTSTHTSASLRYKPQQALSYEGGYQSQIKSNASGSMTSRSVHGHLLNR